LKKLTGVFDRWGKTTASKTWKFGDTVRNWPILDAFASPTRINQIALPELTIEYGSFKDVPRYDRCTTCHLGIDRGIYSRDRLEQLGATPIGAKPQSPVPSPSLASLYPQTPSTADLKATLNATY